jgi:hypothetical protein
VPPTISLNIFENATQQSLSGTIINLLKNNIYVFECSAFSNPGVSLFLYDTNTNKLLSDSYNTISSLKCNSYGIGCAAKNSVSIETFSTQFDNMTSITCMSKSLNSNVSLSANLTQSLTISKTSINN